MSSDKNGINTMDSVMRWISFGVLASVLPTSCTAVFNAIVGLSFSYRDFLSDVILVVLAVCWNFINMCTDRNKRVAYLLRWIMGIPIGVVVLACWGLYFMIKGGSSIEIKQEVMETLLWIALAVVLACLLIGGVIEAYTGIKMSRNLKSENGDIS